MEPNPHLGSSVKEGSMSFDVLDFFLQLIGSQASLHVNVDAKGLLADINRLFHDPNAVAQALTKGLEGVSAITVTGTIECRVAFILIDHRLYALSMTGSLFSALSSQPDLQAQGHFEFGDKIGIWIDNAVEIYRHISQPRIKLIALYHPENFPLPRFSLAISDIARALRSQLLGTVELHDMQLGETVGALAEEISKTRPDIIGISITFGQYDVLEALMQKLSDIHGYSPLVVLGGSLAVRISELLLRRYPKVLIATGDGERPMRDLVRAYRDGQHDEVLIDGLLSINQTARKLKIPQKHSELDYIPELDLLPSILSADGVMQLESSRGCSFACSFCPRDHKGIWTGDDPSRLTAILSHVNNCFKNTSNARRIFLVDEEFIGYRADAIAAPRVLQIAHALKMADFTFETSSRLDQVVRKGKSRDWHRDRFDLWRNLVDSGLDRCLFGIESGVDSILTRFNKKTTSDQIVKGIRAVTALGIPYRLTYITFDQLMSLGELLESFLFLSREDLILKPQGSSADSIWDLIHDDNACLLASSGAHFYEEVSYMLVTMEALIGAPYTNVLGAKNMLGSENPLMGRYEANFVDRRIGAMSRCSQEWVDRNFSLDYLLKSIEKISVGQNRQNIRSLRHILRRYSYTLLANFLFYASGRGDVLAKSWKVEIDGSVNISLPIGESSIEVFTTVLYAVMDRHFADLCQTFQASFYSVRDALPVRDADRLYPHIMQWSEKNVWSTINDVRKVQA